MKHACIRERVDRITKQLLNSDIEAVINDHYDLMMARYKLNPLFYKTLFKSDRYMVALALLSKFYSTKGMTLSVVRSFCEERGYLSKNTLESYFSFFLITKRMTIITHPSNGRLRVYEPSAQALAETKAILDTHLLPLASLSMENLRFLTTSNSSCRSEHFLRGFAQLLDARCTLDIIVPDAHWMLNRDGGYMLVLALYIDMSKNRNEQGGYKSSTYAALSSLLCVSSTHLMRLVREGETRGYFKNHKNIVEVTPKFESFVRTMMACTFAITLVSVELGEVQELGSFDE
ncbi:MULTISPECIES: hypothetical protein [Pseudomonas]|uniref:Uncharacterized protein n=2 Tax=Pseudomonadaceae TaxID=135621 RepID=A0A0D0L5C9_9PSED|nr:MULTISPECIES: hypothetical protein [Pseudomonas]KIQ06177.1 hypothetical protein RU08_01940 [Pseudomonas fulva]MCW2293644.1 hypothetical protein [Pseudomonas sp. BIGb0408]NYH71787.1 hypothetical protein [Pseudomonas flavescens]